MRLFLFITKRLFHAHSFLSYLLVTDSKVYRVKGTPVTHQADPFVNLPLNFSHLLR